MRRTVDALIDFYCVADYFAAAMNAGRRQELNGALKAVEDIQLPCQPHFKCFLAVVPTEITADHAFSPTTVALLVSSSSGCAREKHLRIPDLYNCVLQRLRQACSEAVRVTIPRLLEDAALSTCN